VGDAETGVVAACSTTLRPNILAARIPAPGGVGVRVRIELPQTINDIRALARLRALLGEEQFRAEAAEHLDDESLTTVPALLGESRDVP